MKFQIAGMLFWKNKSCRWKSNKNRVQAFDGPIHIADAAMYLNVPQPDTWH